MKTVNIKARSDSKIYQAELGNLKIDKEDLLLFESDQCQEVAQIISDDQPAGGEEEGKVSDLPSAIIIRRLNEKDQEIDQERKEEAARNLEKCREIIVKHDLPMELIGADLSFDNKKLTFYFSAPGRVDFRSLVSELASNFQKLIRLQQVGARDRAKCIGGIGRCGQGFCCKRFLKGDLEGVSIDMAYEQNLGQMGPNRVTGACGKLMCCLKYELDAYKKAKGHLPKIGTTLKTPKGSGIVISQKILENIVTVELENKTYVEVDCTK